MNWYKHALKVCLWQKRFYSAVDNANRSKRIIINRVSPKKGSHATRINKFFKKEPHLEAIKSYIPIKYMSLKKRTLSDNLYLIDSEIAKKIVSYALPLQENQVICETNAGLGFVANELLDNGVKLVRLYESCGDFKLSLKYFNEKYPGRVELFNKDIFLLHRYEFMDKQDNGNRVEQLLRGVPNKIWTDDPVMTIFGAMSNPNFIRFLARSLILQSTITNHGRVQLYAIMRPCHYIVLTAGPDLNLHTYRNWSIIFRMFFDYELLDKYPRNAFLPWESEKKYYFLRYASQIDRDLMYLVRINFKKQLPVSVDNLLTFFSFVMHFFGNGTARVIPSLEKWVPGAGLNAILPKLRHERFFKDMTIYTTFGELSPEEILGVFEEMIHHEEYEGSPFKALVENSLIKSETIETVLNEQLEKHIVDDIEVKFDNQ